MNVAFPFFAMELLSDGWLFVLPSDVLLSANRHKLRRIRVNAAKSDRLLDHVHEHFNDIGNVSELCQCVAATLLDLEKCDSLDVYRESLPREFKQCFDGDLTPLVLVQFMCAGYLKIEQTDRRRFCVTYDEQLFRGVFRFRDYAHRFVEHLCAQSKTLAGRDFELDFVEYGGEAQAEACDPHDRQMEADAPTSVTETSPKSGTAFEPTDCQRAAAQKVAAFEVEAPRRLASTVDALDKSICQRLVNAIAAITYEKARTAMADARARLKSAEESRINILETLTELRHERDGLKDGGILDRELENARGNKKKAEVRLSDAKAAYGVARRTFMSYNDDMALIRQLEEKAERLEREADKLGFFQRSSRARKHGEAERMRRSVENQKASAQAKLKRLGGRQLADYQSDVHDAEAALAYSEQLLALASAKCQGAPMHIAELDEVIARREDELRGAESLLAEVRLSYAETRGAVMTAVKVLKGNA